MILLGALAQRDPAFADLRLVAGALAELTGATLGYLPDGGNSVGACLAGVLPHRTLGGRAAQPAGLNVADMFAARLKSYILLGAIEPALDIASPAALEALKAAEFVVALSPYGTAKEFAHVILPIGTFAETSGTYVNLEGRWQSVPGAATPVGESRPAWKVLRVLGNLLNLPGFDYTSSDQITEEVRKRARSCAGVRAEGVGAHAAVEARARRGGRRGRRVARRADLLRSTPWCVVRAPCRARAKRATDREGAARERHACNSSRSWLSFLPQWMQAVVWYGVVALVLFITVILMMAFLTLIERRVIGSIQARIGPNRVGPDGHRPAVRRRAQAAGQGNHHSRRSSNKFLFLIAPLLALIPALCTWAVMPLWPGFTVANINAGLLYILALTSTGVYGIILAGWATNSKYALLGAMRARGADGRVRDRDGLRAGRRGHGRGLAESRRDHRGAARRLLQLLRLVAAAAVRRVLHLGPRRDQPRAVRRGRRRVGNRRRLPRRVLGHGVRRVLRRRVREHDPDLGADLGVLLRRLAVAVRGLSGCRTSCAAPGLHWLVAQDLVLPVLLPVVPRHVPALPLRPDHAARLEGLHPGDAGVDHRGRRVLKWYEIGPWAK